MFKYFKMRYLTIVLLAFISFNTCAKSTFQEVLDEFAEYQLPLDPQTLLTNKSKILPISVFNKYFFKYRDTDPYLILDDGEKSPADLAGEVEEESIEYAPGKFDNIKVYPLGKVNLHQDFSSVIFAVSNMEYDNVYIYNFDESGQICSGLALTVKDNLASTYRASLKYYSFIEFDKTIISRDFGELAVLNMSFAVNDDGIFQMLTWEEDTTYYQEPDWGINKKLTEINRWAAEGVPVLKN